MIEFKTTLTTDLSKLFGSAIRKLANRRVMASLGALAITRIKERTGRGVDVHNQNFEPYSSEWAEKRQKKGRQISKVDLLFTGRMWNALHQDADDDSVELFFTGHEATKAHGHNYGIRANAFFGKVPQREFFGLNQADEDELGREILRALQS